MTIYAHIEGQPATATAQQKGVFVVGGKPRFFTKKKVKDAQTALVRALKPYAPPAPVDRPVWLSVRFRFINLEASRKHAAYADWHLEHDRRPDLDNLLKGILDALVPAGWLTDDARVYRLEAEKSYGPVPGTHICMGYGAGVSSPRTTNKNASCGLVGAKKSTPGVSQKGSDRVGEVDHA